MSKKQLLEETTVRKFMKLANLEPLSDRFIKEEMGYTEEEDMGAPTPEMGPADAGMDFGDEMDAGGDEELEVDLDDAAGGEVSPEVAKKVVKAVLDALGVQGTVEDDEDMGDDSAMGDMDAEMGGEEDAGESESGEEEAGEENGEEESEEEELDEAEEQVEGYEKEMDESRLAEDALVENVLRRVTARLLAEAKASKKKKDVKDKMKAKKDEKSKKEEKLDEENHVKTHKKSNPLLTKGKNKYNTYKGKPDHVIGKGENGGKGGEEWKPLKASQKHTVTHDKTSKVTSKGSNKA